LQLIQYLPPEEPFHQVPLFIIPPWINKYYIFDLQKENSFIAWNIERGRAVYVISWINPGSSHAKTSLEDYLLKGIDPAIEMVKKITNTPKINALGFCVGGVALLTLMSYYHKKQLDHLNSATLLASPVDFRLMGDLSIFVNKEELTSVELLLKRQGGLDGEAMMHIFRSLRANELIWPNYINNYLLGKKPQALDLLFWNSDITNVPAKMHIEYLREFYIGNALNKANKYYLDGVGIDISQVQTPSFVIATQKDHIVPWKSAYVGFQKMKNSQFLLGGSGHIAGIINPPVRKKYGFWTNEQAPHSTTADAWLKGAVEYAGSWWEEWEKWLTPFLGDKTQTAKQIKSQVIEDAPGHYALQKAPQLKPNALFSSVWGN
jgi:polyhydroxyalkanoate synthase